MSQGLLAFTSTGIVPILLPLALDGVHGRASHVGVVLSAIGAGMMTAPLWATSADQFRWHRMYLVAAPLAVALSLVGFSMKGPLGWALFWGALQGCGLAAAATVANLLISCCNSDEHVADAFGALQTVNSIGGVAGLVAAGALSHLPHDLAFRVAAGLAVVSALIGLIFVPAPPPGSTLKSQRLQRETDRPGASPSGMILLLICWLVSNVGMFGLHGFYPLLMRKVFSVPPLWSSLVAAAGSAAGAALFVQAGRLTDRLGPLRVLNWSLAIRCAGLAGLIGAYHMLDGRAVTALALYFFVGLTWPFMAVSSASLVSRMALRKGRGLGFYSGSEATANWLGPSLAGHLAESLGYHAVIQFAFWSAVGGLPLLAALGRVSVGRPVRSGEKDLETN